MFLTSPLVEKIARAGLYASAVVFVLVVFLHRDFVDAAIDEWTAPLAARAEKNPAPADTYADLLASAEEQSATPKKQTSEEFSETLDALAQLCPRESRAILAQGILKIHHQTRREGRPLSPKTLANLLREHSPQETSITCVEHLEAQAFLRRL